MSVSMLNKIAASLVICIIVICLGDALAYSLFPDTSPARPLIALQPPKKENIRDYLPHAQPRRGQQLFLENCARCHAISTRDILIGPPLGHIFNAPIATFSHYAYSPALASHHGEHWDIQELSEWLENPADFAPGTRMSFAGIESAQERADIIAYLHSLLHSQGE